jgi:hypothetical protein
MRALSCLFFSLLSSSLLFSSTLSLSLAATAAAAAALSFSSSLLRSTLLSRSFSHLTVGVGKSLRLYELGKKKLLKKCENKSFPTCIVKLHVNADRIYVCDLTESVHFVKYRRAENAFVIFADECSPRYELLTALALSLC